MRNMQNLIGGIVGEIHKIYAKQDLKDRVSLRDHIIEIVLSAQAQLYETKPPLRHIYGLIAKLRKPDKRLSEKLRTFLTGWLYLYQYPAQLELSEVFEDESVLDKTQVRRELDAQADRLIDEANNLTDNRKLNLFLVLFVAVLVGYGAGQSILTIDKIKAIGSYILSLSIIN